MPSPKKYGPNSHWTNKEVAMLVAMSIGHTALEIGLAIGRSVQSVQSKASRAGIRLIDEGTSTTFGRFAEKQAQTILDGSMLLTEADYHSPYDLIWNGQRVNVKATTLQYVSTAGCWYWKFTTKQSWKNCDLFLFLGYQDDKNFPCRAWLVPSHLCQKRSIAMSRNYAKGKYAKYEIEVKGFEGIVDG